ncbi:MAG: type III PLP-dependent enzyme [Actinobacteria bacterium]|nr:type III PLP-dependent enzyme [Actinomycetota bacterium]
MTTPGREKTRPTTTSLLSAARSAEHATPFLVMDLAAVDEQIRQFRELLPNVFIHYAMKCNPEPRVLQQVVASGATFEIASLAELRTLLHAGIPVDDVIFSNPVKIAEHIDGAYAAGVRTFAFDSLAELDKLACHAPGAQVYVRLRTLDINSVVPSEGKFGVDLDEAVELMVRARSLGLVPSGIGFHVGSQMMDPYSWTVAIIQSATLMRRLEREGIRITMLDLGGGFPARYEGETPHLAAIADAIRTALADDLPYPVDRIVIEPGRGLVADAGIMVATVIGTAVRAGTSWLHLDVGAFNGMMESLETRNTLRFPMTDSKSSPGTRSWHVTGPTCDSQDTLLLDVDLSADLVPGDRVFIHTAGAYTTCYASTFNGFDRPQTYCLDADFEL